MRDTKDIDQDETDVEALRKVLWRFWTRIECCPCLNQSCVQCRNDIEVLDALEKQLDRGPLFERWG